jgi:hypothetical protein
MCASPWKSGPSEPRKELGMSAGFQFAEKLCFWVAQRFTAAVSRLF